jgi:hypothetical protein
MEIEFRLRHMRGMSPNLFLPFLVLFLPGIRHRAPKAIMTSRRNERMAGPAFFSHSKSTNLFNKSDLRTTKTFSAVVIIEPKFHLIMHRETFRFEWHRGMLERPSPALDGAFMAAQKIRSSRQMADSPSRVESRGWCGRVGREVEKFVPIRIHKQTNC